PRKARIERLHECRFFAPFVATRRHLRVKIPDVPVIGDRKMTGVRSAVDESKAVLAEHAITASIIDEARDEEFFVRMLAEIACDRGGVLALRQASAGVRAARPDNSGKSNARRQIGKREL